jgi:DNA-binding GntR family transcriptional regulator
LDDAGAQRYEAAKVTKGTNPVALDDGSMNIEAALHDRLTRRMQRAGVPKYLHLVEAIEELVREGVLKEGHQLPAESLMAQQVPLSLGTIQKAMAVLQTHGFVSREHGRGTFVRAMPKELRDLWHFRFLAADGVSILPVYPEVLSAEAIEEDASAPSPWAQFLGPEERYVKITRAVNVAGEFTVASEFFMSHRRCMALLDMPSGKLKTAHLRDVLRERFGLVTARVVEQVSCEPFRGEICRVTGLKNGSLGLVCRILAFDFRDHPVSFHLIYVPPKTRRLEMRERMPQLG